MSFASLLVATGIQVRGQRFGCPNCDGGSSWTGAFSEAKQVGFCHRCHTAITARQLASRQGIILPARKIKPSEIMWKRFSEWLKTKAAELSNRERCLARRAEWAKAALTSFPDMETAWGELAAWYHARQTYELFWESAQDNIGRYWLYRHWRRHAQ